MCARVCVCVCACECVCVCLCVCVCVCIYTSDQDAMKSTKHTVTGDLKEMHSAHTMPGSKLM